MDPKAKIQDPVRTLLVTAASGGTESKTGQEHSQEDRLPDNLILMDQRDGSVVKGPVLMHQLPNNCKSTSMESDAFFWPLKGVGVYLVHMQTCKHSYVQVKYSSLELASGLCAAMAHEHTQNKYMAM